ncbi:peptide chain release factor N(5)-glutamine methyltransferase [Minwuia sp.]|uniref:peptide chain release factor N(5)-glutamine methyltransferase n=1 Tax=Minwuia sp. TaxID=2493630 RepID=UPI003A92ED7B
MIPESGTVEGLLREGALALREAGIETARLDARILLARILDRPSNSLLPGDDTPVDPDLADSYRALIRRRMAHEPVSRIIGRRAFYGRDFGLSPATLDPRPDSEAVVELALEGLAPKARVLDLGTGTGCLLLTIVAECDGAQGVGVDLSDDALAVARLNATALALSDRVQFRRGNWLDGIRERFDLIISNPPYIPDADVPDLMPEVRLFDPVLALAGGADGLAPYRCIFHRASDHLTDDGRLVVEIGAGQADNVISIAEAEGFVLHRTATDLGGHTRGLSFTVPS